MLRNTDTDGTLAEFEKFRTEYWIYVLDKLSVIKTKYKQMKRNISRWYPAFFLWVTVPFSISALQKVFPAQEQINKTQKKKTKRGKRILKQRPHHFSAPEMSLTQSGNHWLTYPFQLSKSYLLFFSFTSFCSAFVSFFTKLRDLFEIVSIFQRNMKYHGILLDFFCSTANCLFEFLMSIHMYFICRELFQCLFQCRNSICSSTLVWNICNFYLKTQDICLSLRMLFNFFVWHNTFSCCRQQIGSTTGHKSLISLAWNVRQFV